MYDEFNDKEQNLAGGSPADNENILNDPVPQENPGMEQNYGGEAQDGQERQNYSEGQDYTQSEANNHDQSYTQPAADNYGQPYSQDQAGAGQQQDDSFYHYRYDREQQEDGQQQARQQTGQQERSYGTYQTGQPSGPAHYEKPKKKKSMAAKIAAAASIAVVFGVVASASFQITDYVGGKMFPQTKETETKISSTGTVNTKTTAVSAPATDIVNVAENAMPSIVAITSQSVKEVQTYFYGTQKQEEESSGSGIIIGKNDKELLIATNNHVVEGSEVLTVCFTVNVENQEEKVVQAQVKGTDPEHDLAMVAVQLSDIPSDVLSQIKIIEIGDSDSLQVGERAIAIGNALGYGQSVTSGIVSALNREVSVETSSGTVTNSLIQTDAAINFGNSGGALLNINGQLIGINSVKAASSGVEGMGYAIPINTAKPILDELMNLTTRTKVDSKDQGALGVNPVDVSEEAKQVYNMPSGAFLYKVQADSAAEKAGLIKGDIISKVDGVSISSANDLVERMKYYKAGEKVTLEVQAAQSGEYKSRSVEVTLGKKSDLDQTQESESESDQQRNDEAPVIPGGDQDDGFQQFFDF